MKRKIDDVECVTYNDPNFSDIIINVHEEQNFKIFYLSKNRLARTSIFFFNEFQKPDMLGKTEYQLNVCAESKGTTIDHFEILFQIMYNQNIQISFENIIYFNDKKQNQFVHFQCQISYGKL